MLELFTGIHKVVFNKLSDDTWTAAYDSAFQVQNPEPRTPNP